MKLFARIKCTHNQRALVDVLPDALLVVSNQPQTVLKPFLDNSQGLKVQDGHQLAKCALGLLQGAPGSALAPILNLHSLSNTHPTLVTTWNSALPNPCID